jgi:hypothetical protein
MIVTTTRTNKQNRPQFGPGIFGNVTIDTSPFKCIFMERDGVQIPVGVYPIKWLWSDHFQQFMPHITNVAGRVAIEQHWANYPNQLDGCQSMGTVEEMANDCIDESKDAWTAYCTIIINEPNVMLKVVEDYGPAVTV